MSIERVWSQDLRADRPEPPSAAAEAPTEQASAIPVVDEAAQRELMEEQLHEQARTLDPAALHPAQEPPGAAPTPLPESARVRGETRSLDELLSHCGRYLLAADGEMIGKIAEIYVDELTGEPEWIGVDVHAVAGSHRVVAPVQGSYIFARDISVPYTRAQVAECQVRELRIAPEREHQLYAHYGLPYARRITLPDRAADSRFRIGGRRLLGLGAALGAFAALAAAAAWRVRTART